jgi:DNA-binding HxlR family transcriptional regulator
MSSSVLRQRLAELVQRPEAGYALSPLGADAYRALRPLVRWSDRRAAELDGRPPHRAG